MNRWFRRAGSWRHSPDSPVGRSIDQQLRKAALLTYTTTCLLDQLQTQLQAGSSACQPCTSFLQRWEIAIYLVPSDEATAKNSLQDTSLHRPPNESPLIRNDQRSSI